MIKPTYLVFLAVPLLMNIPIWKRLIMFVAGCVIGASPTLYAMIAQPELTHDWMLLANSVSYDLFPGNGFFGWLSFSGVPANSLFIKPLYLFYASTILMAGFGICERLLKSAKFPKHEAVWIAIAISVLLNPRLFSYDCLLMGPGLIALIYACRDSDRTVWGRPLYKFVSAMVLFGALFGLFCNLAGPGKVFDIISPAVFVIAVLVAGLPEFWPALKARPEWKTITRQSRAA